MVTSWWHNWLIDLTTLVENMYLCPLLLYSLSIIKERTLPQNILQLLMLKNMFSSFLVTWGIRRHLMINHGSWSFTSNSIAYRIVSDKINAKFYFKFQGSMPQTRILKLWILRNALHLPCIWDSVWLPWRALIFPYWISSCSYFSTVKNFFGYTLGMYLK